MEKNILRKGLPENAHCVFNGVIFEVWQWQQEMFDGSTQTFERAWRPETVEIIATCGDKILIEEQSQPDRKNYMTLVSGRVDAGEDVLSAAKRELLEETGCASDNWQEFFSHSFDGKVLHDVHYFVAKTCQKVQEQHLDPGEKIKVLEVSFDDFLLLTDKPRFFAYPEFGNRMLRARYDADKKEEMRKLFFDV